MRMRISRRQSRSFEGKRLKSQEDDFSATTQREKMHKREEELRAQFEILAAEIDDIAAVNESLAISALPNLIGSAEE
jgi:hypothetical protein